MKKLRFLMWFAAFLIQAAAASAQQPYQLKGVVLDSAGEPLIGASILVEGSSQGIITDMDGKFTLSVKKGDVLKFSYVGFVSQELAITGQNNVKIVLKDDAQSLEEVVVVGYGTMKKQDLTGAIAQINPDKIADSNPNTVQDILRMGTAGLHVTYDTSAKGGGTFQLRGQNSLYTEGGHNSPLIILDNMDFYGDLSEINPADIAQINVLKDASAAAIYGARAASGVIIITTKKGKMGKPVINASANFSVSNRTNYRKVYSADDYLKFREVYYKSQTYGVNPETGKYEYYQSGTVKPGYYDHYSNLSQYGVSQDEWLAYTTNGDQSLDEVYARRLGLYESDDCLAGYLRGFTYNWADDGFRTAFSQDYNASISGATEHVNYYLSAGYLKNEGVVRGDNFRAFRANMKINGQVTKWLEVGANVNFQDRTDDSQKIDWEGHQNNSPFAPKYNEDGSLRQYPMSVSMKRGANSDFGYQYEELEKGYQVLNTIFNAKVTLPFGLSYQFNISPRYQFWQDRYFMSAELPNSDPVNRGVNRGWSKNFDWSLNNIITWDYEIAKVHHFVVTLAQEAEERKYWSDNIKARNILPTDALGFHNTQNGTKENGSMDTNDTHSSADALLGRLFYSYDNRYMLTASIRRDGYSAFGTNNPYATFPSLAVAWSFTNEKFWKWKWMDTGKLRASWGKNGNRSLANEYLALADLGSGTGATMGYLNANGGVATDMKYLSYGRLANPNLQWEKTEALNFGLDFGFLDYRINGSIDYYHKKTHDMIMNMPLPGFSGVDNITTNLGQVNNSGVEITLNTVNMSTRNFEWTTSASFSYNKNRIKHLFHEYDENGKEMDYVTKSWFIDRPIGQIWDFKMIGIWQADEVEEAAKYGQRPGDPKVWNNPENDVYDENGNVTRIVYDNDDKVFLGQTNPPFHWSLTNNFTLWKSLDISFSLYSYMGHKKLSTDYLNQINGSSGITYGFNTYVRNYWTPENGSNKFARWEGKGPSGCDTPSRIFKMDFIRLDNITVGYTLPQAWTRKCMIEKCRISGSINNAATWASEWDYNDPETTSFAKRTFNLGLQITL